MEKQNKHDFGTLKLIGPAIYLMQTAVIRFRDLHHLSAFINDANNCVKAIITVDHQHSLCLYEVSNTVYKSYRARKRWIKIATVVNITMYLSTLYRQRCEDFSLRFKEWCSYYPAAPFANNELDIDQSKVAVQCPVHHAHKYYLIQRGKYQLVQTELNPQMVNMNPHARPTKIQPVQVMPAPKCICNAAIYGSESITLWNGGRPKPDYSELTAKEWRLQMFQYVYGDYHGMSRKMRMPRYVNSSYGCYDRDGVRIRGSHGGKPTGNSPDFQYNGKVCTVTYVEYLIPLLEEERMAVYHDSRELVRNQCWLNSYNGYVRNYLTSLKRVVYDPSNQSGGFHTFWPLNEFDNIIKIGQDAGFLSYREGKFWLSSGESVDDPVIQGQTYTDYMEIRNKQYIEHLEHLRKYQECQNVLDTFWNRIAKKLGEEYNDYCGVVGIGGPGSCTIGWCNDTTGTKYTSLADKLRGNTKTTAIYYQILGQLSRWLSENNELEIRGYLDDYMGKCTTAKLNNLAECISCVRNPRVGQAVNILVDGNTIIKGMDFWCPGRSSGRPETVSELTTYYQICTELRSFFENIPYDLLYLKPVKPNCSFNEYCLRSIGLSVKKQKEIKLHDIKAKIAATQKSIDDAIKGQSYDVAHNHQVLLKQLVQDLAREQASLP